MKSGTAIYLLNSRLCVEIDSYCGLREMAYIVDGEADPDFTGSETNGIYAVHLGDFVSPRLFLASSDGETETTRLRMEWQNINVIYPLFRNEVYADRQRPVKMVADVASDELKRTLRPYWLYPEDENPRQFWMDEELYILLKLKF